MKPPDNRLLIAITGGIASGKSTVACWLENRGYQVINTDLIGHGLLQDPKVITLITENFGDQICSSGRIDRRKLAEIVFQDELKLKLLNDILHSRILLEMQDRINESEYGIIFCEIPLLYENNLQGCFDLVVNIHVSREMQIERITEKFKISRESAAKRINTQLNPAEKYLKADVNIQNNGTLSELFEQLERFEENLENISPREKKGFPI
ncbi:MAG: dephospho-CoA kinase [Candidatus Cloacimonetes bacterium]|nr:dephospho-CoA kinase [Candidatus Cloacimonadota bacterium]